jgi:uncharacterized Zn-finger protein
LGRRLPVRAARGAGAYNPDMPATDRPNVLPLLQPNAQNRYEVTREDVPLSCPMPSMSLWNSHPRVYLPIEATGFAKCPYCSAEFTLKR